MITQTISQDDVQPEIEDKSDEYSFRLPDAVRIDLTNHFLALMGAEPLSGEELLAA